MQTLKNVTEYIQLLLLQTNVQNSFYIHQPFLLNIQDLLNSKWHFIRFLILIKFQYISVFRRHYNITKISILIHLFMRFTFFFSCKRMKEIQTNEITVTRLIVFFTARKCLLLLESLRELFVLQDLSYVLKHKQDMVFLFQHAKH